MARLFTTTTSDIVFISPNLPGAAPFGFKGAGFCSTLTLEVSSSIRINPGDAPGIGHRMNLGVPPAGAAPFGFKGAGFARGIFRFGFPPNRAQQRHPAITAKRNKVQIAAPIVALQILRHDQVNPRAHV